MKPFSFCVMMHFTENEYVSYMLSYSFWCFHSAKCCNSRKWNPFLGECEVFRDSTSIYQSLFKFREATQIKLVIMFKLSLIIQS